jgi:hypothetical protein
LNGGESSANGRWLEIRSDVMRTLLTAIATAGALASGAAFAGTATVQNHEPRFDSATILRVQYDRSDRWDDRGANINEREARINARIQRGIEDGRITDREARRLYGELRGVEAKERAFRSDGRIGGREEAELHRDLDRLAANVRDQVRDDQRRY